MLKIIFIFSFVVLGGFVQIKSCESAITVNDPIIEPDTDQVQPAEKFLSISDLNSEKPGKGIFETRGFVAKIYTCPACPPDAQCKPCIAENIVISEEKKSLENYDLSEKEMIIFSSQSKKFSIGSRYKFKIEIKGQKSTGSRINDARLIRADKKSV